MIIRRVFHMFKSIRLAFLLPFFLIFVIIPLATYQNYLMTDIYLAEEFFIKIIQYIIPIASVLWLCFSTINYFHDKGKELIWIQDVHTNNSLEYSLTILGIYLVVISIFMLIANYFFSNMFFEFIRLVSLSLFFYSIYYMLLFAFKTTGISIIGVSMIYLFMLVAPSQLFYRIIVFTPTEPAYLELLLYKYLPITLLSVSFFTVGTLFSRNYRF